MIGPACRTGGGGSSHDVAMRIGGWDSQLGVRRVPLYDTAGEAKTASCVR